MSQGLRGCFEGASSSKYEKKALRCNGKWRLNAAHDTSKTSGVSSNFFSFRQQPVEAVYFPFDIEPSKPLDIVGNSPPKL